MTTWLRVARPVAGIVGASGLKLLGCLWFAIGLGTVTLLPRADGARERAVVIGALADVPVRPSTPRARPAEVSAVPRRAVARRAVPQQVRSPHTTPTASAVGVASTGRPSQAVNRPEPVARAPVAAQSVSAPAPLEEDPALAPLVTTPELPVVGAVTVPAPVLPVAVPQLPPLPQVEVPGLTNVLGSP